ncbi:glycosyltransferase family 2 protein [Actinomarinicola tropica]|uniref:glycosyltransferase family 2 protein n=1 Tax=Actinomarinicola tropica TaxID=2789776 RepID=UPI00189BC674|nr:glycosyltransferase family A protein [Actinomarinicola tropica]
MRISVVVPCFDYERFVGQALDSVLTGTRAPDELIVVDDGSTDRSAEVAAAREGVIVVRKANGGMASAVNRGIAESTGDVVVLLDADDLAAPGRLAWVEEAFADPAVVMAWHPLVIRDERGGEHGCCPSGHLPGGDLVSAVLAEGLPSFAVTSGIAVRRSALDAVGPIPDDRFRNFAESYLVRTVPFLGPVASTQQPLGVYRSHSGSDMRRVDGVDVPAMVAKLDKRLAMADTEHATLVEAAAAAGHQLLVEDLRAWDDVYLDLHRARARLRAPSRRAAWREMRAVDAGNGSTGQLLAAIAYTVAPRSFVVRHQLVRGGEPDVRGLSRAWSIAYWRWVALRQALARRRRRSGAPLL